MALMKGSENVALAVDLINNVMSSQRICDRAFSGAAVPTVEDFYKIYGDIPCLNFPERPTKLLPETTFADLREMFFKNARSRSQIFDYRLCMRELHSILEYIHAFPARSATDMGTRIDEALNKIRELSGRGWEPPKWT
jgi:hypothetical protein